MQLSAATSADRAQADINQPPVDNTQLFHNIFQPYIRGAGRITPTVGLKTLS